MCIKYSSTQSHCHGVGFLPAPSPGSPALLSVQVFPPSYLMVKPMQGHFRNKPSAHPDVVRVPVLLHSDVPCGDVHHLLFERHLFCVMIWDLLGIWTPADGLYSVSGSRGL